MPFIGLYFSKDKSWRNPVWIFASPAIISYVLGVRDRMRHSDKQENDVFREREKKMGKLPGKIVFSLILYATGFLTAIYLLVPSPANASEQIRSGETTTQSQDAQPVTGKIDINSQEWILTARAGIDTAIRFAEEYALRAADLIREKTGQGSDQGG